MNRIPGYKSATRLLAVGLVLALLAPTMSQAIHAMEGPVPEVADGGTAAFSLHGSVGFLSGEAREIVYIPQIDHKMSELIWDLSGLMMVGAVGSVNLYNTFRVNLGLWTAATEGNGGMEDYDWYIFDRPGTWTHQSIHDVKIVDSLLFDLNVSVEIYAFSGASLRAIIGYKRDFWKWEDAFRSQTYSSLGVPDGYDPGPGYSWQQFDADAIRDRPASGDGSRSIDYEQTFSFPYFGVSLEGMLGPVRMSGYLVTSTSVSAEDADFHRNRNLHFKETFEGGTYVGVGLSVVYLFRDNLYAMASYDYQSVQEINGDISIAETGAFIPDAAGISNEHGMLSLSMGMTF